MSVLPAMHGDSDSVICDLNKVGEKRALQTWRKPSEKVMRGQSGYLQVPLRSDDPSGLFYCAPGGFDRNSAPKARNWATEGESNNGRNAEPALTFNKLRA